jgi:hypothetical protein
VRTLDEKKASVIGRCRRKKESLDAARKPLRNVMARIKQAGWL